MGLTLAKLHSSTQSNGAGRASTHQSAANDGGAHPSTANTAHSEANFWQEEYFGVIADYISGFRGAYPSEAGVRFRKPLTWSTHFAEDNLQNINFGIGYQKKTQQDGTPVIFSEDGSQSGHPHFLLTRNSINKWEVEVW